MEKIQELITITEEKRKEIAGWILPLRWCLLNHGCKKSMLRVKIAEKFRATKQYVDKTWTTDEFCLTWDWLEREKRI
jgi:hypothetical protein